MKKPSNINWESVRQRAGSFPEGAFQFVREGLAHTVGRVHGNSAKKGTTTISAPGLTASAALVDERRHVTGQQLCNGLRDMAIERYGLMARAVLTHWGVQKTDDFGTIVYALIDRGELRCSDDDDLSHFSGVYDFDETFARPPSN